MAAQQSADGRSKPARVSGPPIRSQRWAEYELTATIDPDAVRVGLGGTNVGVGVAWFDDFVLEVRDGADSWAPVTISNAGFEDPRAPAGWLSAPPDAFDRTIDARAGASNEHALRVARRFEPTALPQFPSRPALGEMVERSLGARHVARFPLALPLVGGRTPTITSPPSVIADGAEATSIESSSAAVIVAWNVFQHFYPYHEAIDESWASALEVALLDASDDRSRSDGHDTLRRLVARLHDGHGWVMGMTPPGGNLGVDLVWADKHAVVQQVAVGSSLRRGDVLLEIDGTPVSNSIETAMSMSMWSGTQQWTRSRALSELGVGQPDTIAALVIERNGERIELAVPRVRTRDPALGPRWPFVDRPAIERQVDGIYYVDLRRAAWPEINAVLGKLALAPGVVFDLRGYPNGLLLELLPHLMRAPEHDRFMYIPMIVYPDRERIAGWSESGWDVTPALPHIGGKLAFIVNGDAISHAEGFMGYVEAFDLGEIVGSPTAGTNGNVADFSVPGDFAISFTGMSVTRHDGSQQHGIGVLPTVALEPTTAGLRAGRDEQLERAFDVVRRRGRS